MRGFQLFTTGMQEVGKDFRKRNRELLLQNMLL